MNTETGPDWIESVQWNDDGLVPVIAQEIDTGKVLTLAWMNREALQTSVSERRAVYWSRSRQKLWRKGEESGYVQQLEQVRLDCDQDAILLQVKQLGGIACHTGRERCFYKLLENGQWQDDEPVLKDPANIYQ